MWVCFICFRPCWNLRRLSTTSCVHFTTMSNKPLSNYASVPANNNPKSRLRAKFSYICCTFSHEASTSGYCSRELKRNSKCLLTMVRIKVAFAPVINPNATWYISQMKMISAVRQFAVVKRCTLLLYCIIGKSIAWRENSTLQFTRKWYRMKCMNLPNLSVWICFLACFRSHESHLVARSKNRWALTWLMSWNRQISQCLESMSEVNWKKYSTQELPTSTSYKYFNAVLYLATKVSTFILFFKIF